MLTWMLLTDPAPARASAPLGPLPVDPERAAEPPMVSASMLAVESALRLTSPAAFTVEFSMVALTDCPAPLPISLSATDAPTAPDGAGPLPLVAAMLIAKPPASEWILEPSLALSSTLLRLCVALPVLPPVIPASTVCVIVLVDPAPAPANAPVRPPEDDPGVGVGEGDGLGVGLGEGLGVAVGSGMGSGLGVGVGLGLGDGVGDGEPPEPAPESAAPMVHASIDAVESAVSVTVPKADTVELSMKARMLLWMLLSLSEAPTDSAPELPPPVAAATEIARPPASAAIGLLWGAERLGGAGGVTRLPGRCASTRFVTLVSGPAPRRRSAGLVSHSPR